MEKRVWGLARVRVGRELTFRLFVTAPAFPNASEGSSKRTRHARRLILYILDSLRLRLHTDSKEMAELCLHRVQ